MSDEEFPYNHPRWYYYHRSRIDRAAESDANSADIVIATILFGPIIALAALIFGYVTLATIAAMLGI